MKLIAKRNFRNPGRQIKLDKHEINEDHIHKGALFEIGGARPFEGLNKTDQELVVALNAADCLGDATNPEIVKAVQRELTQDLARLEIPERNLLKSSRHARAEAAA